VSGFRMWRGSAPAIRTGIWRHARFQIFVENRGIRP
jgi:hypothetical protein